MTEWDRDEAERETLRKRYAVENDELRTELRASKPGWMAAAADYDEWLDAIDRGEGVANYHPLLP